MATTSRCNGIAAFPASAAETRLESRHPFPMNLPPVSDLTTRLLQQASAPDLTLQPGDLVASFDYPFDDARFGFTDRTCGIVGRVTRITEEIEGCPRCEISVEFRFRGEAYEQAERIGILSQPPVNGTPAIGRDLPTYGILRIPQA